MGKTSYSPSVGINDTKVKNAPIMVFSQSIVLLGLIDDYESLQFERSHYEIGEFELHINASKSNTEFLIENNLIAIEQENKTVLKKVAIIEHVENAIDEDGSTTDELIITGHELKQLCYRRVTVPTGTDGYDSESGKQETIMKAFVNNNMVSSSDTGRNIPNLIIATDQQRGISDAWRSRFEYVSDKLAEIGKYAKLGWSIYIDLASLKYVFDVETGINRVASQSANSQAFFSEDFDNVKNEHYVQSLLNSANVGYAGGSGDDASRLIQKIGTVSGFNRIEQFLDCSDADTASELLTVGTQKLSEIAETKTFESEIIPDNSFIYEKDYDLGDTVTVLSTKWNIQMDTQITSFKEVYESGKISLEATFGNAIPDLLKIIKRKTKQAVR